MHAYTCTHMFPPAVFNISDDIISANESYGVATIGRLLKNTGLYCKRAL